MSVLSTLPAPIIQMGLVEKIVEVQQNQPAVHQLVAQATTREELRQARSRVSGLDASENGKKVHDREAGGRNPGHGGRHHEDERPGEEQAEEDESPRTRPWTGHIVNLKV